MQKNYPIKPKHLNTKESPKGFECFLGYDQVAILWAFVQFWQTKGNWDPVTHEEFIEFISKDRSKVNTIVNCGIIWFIDEPLHTFLGSKKRKVKVGVRI